LQMNFVVKNDVLVVRVTGELDHHTAVQIRERIDCRVSDDGVMRLILDLSGLTFMDSSGIGVLIGRYKLMRSLGGTLAIVSGNVNVDKMLDLSGIRKLMGVYGKLDEAMKAV